MSIISRALVLVCTVALAGCAGDEPALSSAHEALGAAQCAHFADDAGRVTICHASPSPRHPYQKLRVPVAACAVHAAHAGDYATSSDPSHPAYDPTCGGLGCFPLGTPTDGSVPCCAGLAPAGGVCADVDECALGTDGCVDGPAGTCANTVGGFACGCAPGYSGDGTAAGTGCADLDECALGTDGCVDAPAGTCANSVGGLACGCAPGYSGDGTTAGSGCADVDECALGTDACVDAPAGTCTNSVGGFACGCAPGYSGDGTSAGTGCADLDECATNNGGCGASATCSNNPGAPPTCMALDDLPPCTLGFDGTAAGWNDVRNLPDVFYNEAGLTRTDLGAAARWTLAPSSGFPFFDISRLSYQKLYGVIGVDTFTMEARFRLPSIGASNRIRFTMEVGKSPWEHWNAYVLGETGVVTQMTFNEALPRATITDTAYHTLTYTVAGDTGTLRLDGVVIGTVVENRDFGDHVAFRIENLSFTHSAAIEIDYVRWTAPDCGVPPDGVVDPAATVNTSGTLLAGPSGVMVAYRAETGGGTTALKIARYVGDAWHLETALTGTGAGAYRGAADLDRAGHVHAVFGQGGALHHATDASGAWTTSVIPGMAPGNETMDLDDNDALHVTSAVHVVAPGRRYATNASGTWASRQITTNSSTDAAIVAGGVAQPMLLCNRWQDRTIHFAEGPSFGLQQIHQYGPDQGPPLALVVRAGTPIIAYGNHNGSNGVSMVRVEERVGGSWQRQTIFEFAAGHPIVDNLDLAVDASGARYVAMCDRARNVEIWSNASGAWRKTVGGRCGPSSIDALLLGGRLYVTYAAEATQRLTIRSWPSAAL